MSPLSKVIWRLILRTAGAVCIVLVLWFFGPTLWHLLSPFLLGLPVAAALQKPIRWGEKRLKLKHGLSVAIWVVLVCAILCALLYWLASTVITQVIQLSGNYQTIISDIINLLRNVANQILDALDYMPTAAEEWTRATLNDTFAVLSTTATRWLSVVFNAAINFASQIPYWLIYLNFLLLGIFFISSDYGRIKQRLLDSMGEGMRSRSQMLSGSAGHGVSGYVKVQLLYGILVLAVCWPVLTFMGIPYAFLIALFAALLEFMPIFGNGTLFIPWAIIAYIIGLPRLATGMLAMHLSLYIFRRVTEPKLLSNQMGISTLLSLIAMFVGMQLGGVLGLILSPVVVVVIQSAWQGGLFTSTMADLRCLLAHIGALLAEPPPCDTPPQPEPAPEETTAPGPKT